MNRSQLVYVLPVHNEEKLLADNVARLVAHLSGDVSARFGGLHVYLVENGSRDASWAIAEELGNRSAAEMGSQEGPVEVRAFREPSAGIGWAYQRGLREAIAAFGPSKDYWAVLTAADLPFGFSDLESAFPWFADGSTRIMMGSKAHPRSFIDRGRKRQLMSLVYRAARRLAIGMRVADSQGSVFLRLDLAEKLLPRIESRGFFYSTELCYFAERHGEKIRELPVVLQQSVRPSTVRPLKDGTEMARQLWRLRSRG
ncbi:putative glycosyl transferase [Labilithrix luteola]|uniref:Putative glycosyl transferase n=1 Tax=Labilithrix luteola TaxID=1391654 RepID=A0A0K1PS05_9BACT|nr:glycosyltransferase family 2 protein [Labilithrix luteola]AKU96297.1 putative glycosyl transferase [Labilithrix luteola]